MSFIVQTFKCEKAFTERTGLLNTFLCSSQCNDNSWPQAESSRGLTFFESYKYWLQTLTVYSFMRIYESGTPINSWIKCTRFGIRNRIKKRLNKESSTVILKLSGCLKTLKMHWSTTFRFSRLFENSFHAGEQKHVNSFIILFLCWLTYQIYTFYRKWKMYCLWISWSKIVKLVCLKNDMKGTETHKTSANHNKWKDLFWSYKLSR